MRYMLLIYGDETAMASATPEQMEDTLVAYRVFTDALLEADALLNGDRLQAAAHATTVRGAGAAAQLRSGSFQDAREQLLGYYLIEAPSQEAAVNWASKCPGSITGSVEVRPIFEMPPGTPPYIAAG
jgi:hypothetical protein